MWVLFLILGIVALDQITKFWAASVLTSKTLVVISGLFDFRYAENNGAAWSILQGYRWVLLAVSALMLALLIWNRSEFMKNRVWGRLALALLVGGILGNAIDRLCYGYVIDFIQVYIGSYPFPTFNVADSAICIGVVAYGIMMATGRKR